MVSVRLSTQLKRLVVFAYLSLSITACSTYESRLQNICPSCIEKTLLQDTTHPIKAAIKPTIKHTAKQTVHVYLEGDGIEWFMNRIPPKNPTSEQMTSLRLLALDADYSIYLNRPCYGYSPMPNYCDKRLWTKARYSNFVTEQMNEALDVLVTKLHKPQLVLIGHSGGGTLAMLLASRRNDVVAVVTIAANLDHRYWSQLKGYAPLSESLNAADEVLPNNILRWHFAGGEDKTVPAEVIKLAAQKDPNALFYLKPDFTHNCCWENIWPQVLADLETALSTPISP